MWITSIIVGGLFLSRVALLQPHLDLSAPRNFPHWFDTVRHPPLFHPLPSTSPRVPELSLSLLFWHPQPYNKRSVLKHARGTSPAHREISSPLTPFERSASEQEWSGGGCRTMEGQGYRRGTSPTWAFARKLPLRAREIDQVVTLAWRLIRTYSCGLRKDKRECREHVENTESHLSYGFFDEFFPNEINYWKKN